MEIIGNLWLVWLIGFIASLGYFFWLSWGLFANLTQKDGVEHDPEDKRLTSMTLRTFWPLILACLFLAWLLIAAVYHLLN